MPTLSRYLFTCSFPDRWDDAYPASVALDAISGLPHHTGSLFVSAALYPSAPRGVINDQGQCLCLHLYRFCYTHVDITDADALL